MESLQSLPASERGPGFPLPPRAVCAQERERSLALARTLQAVSTVVPQVVAAFEQPPAGPQPGSLTSHLHLRSSAPAPGAAAVGAIPSRLNLSGRVQPGGHQAASGAAGSPRASLAFVPAPPALAVQGAGVHGAGPAPASSEGAPDAAVPAQAGDDGATASPARPAKALASAPILGSAACQALDLAPWDASAGAGASSSPGSSHITPPPATLRTASGRGGNGSISAAIAAGGPLVATSRPASAVRRSGGRPGALGEAGSSGGGAGRAGSSPPRGDVLVGKRLGSGGGGAARKLSSGETAAAAAALTASTVGHNGAPSPLQVGVVATKASIVPSTPLAGSAPAGR